MADGAAAVGCDCPLVLVLNICTADLQPGSAWLGTEHSNLLFSGALRCGGSFNCWDRVIRVKLVETTTASEYQ